MLFLRSLVYLLGQAVSSVVICIAAFAVFFSPDLRGRVLLQWARFNLWTLERLCGLRFRVEGANHIPRTPCVIISNHQSAWETLAFQLLFPRLSYLVKRELLWIPFFGWGLAMNRPVAIDRSRKMRALDRLVRQGRARLDEGRSLVIFPEGSRMQPGHPGPFQAGGAMIASRSDCPVVPICHNAGVFWPKRGFLKYPGVIDVVIGPPVNPGEMNSRQLNREVEAWIRRRLAELPAGRD